MPVLPTALLHFFLATDRDDNDMDSTQSLDC